MPPLLMVLHDTPSLREPSPATMPARVRDHNVDAGGKSFRRSQRWRGEGLPGGTGLGLAGMSGYRFETLNTAVHFIAASLGSIHRSPLYIEFERHPSHSQDTVQTNMLSKVRENYKKTLNCSG